MRRRWNDPSLTLRAAIGGRRVREGLRFVSGVAAEGGEVGQSAAVSAVGVVQVAGEACACGGGVGEGAERGLGTVESVVGAEAFGASAEAGGPAL